MPCSLHAGFERSKSVITLVVGFFAYLILLYLAYIIELVRHILPTLVNDMDRETFFWTERSEGFLGVYQLSHDCALSVLELQSHISWICSKFAFKEFFTFHDCPVEIETQLGQEYFHTLVRCIQFHDDSRCCYNWLIQCRLYHLLSFCARKVIFQILI